MFFGNLTTAVALETMYQIWLDGWNENITTVLDRNGARGRWLEQFAGEITRLQRATLQARS